MSDKEEISKKSTELISQIDSLKKELDELISNCKHEEHIIKLVSTDGSTSRLRKVCKICKSIIGYPSNEEYENWISE